MQSVIARLENAPFKDLAVDVLRSLYDANALVTNANKGKSVILAHNLALNLAQARAYLFIYNWITDYGPEIAKLVINAQHEGTLERDFPAFQDLVQFVQTKVAETLKPLQTAPSLAILGKARTTASRSLASVPNSLFTHLVPSSTSGITGLSVAFPALSNDKALTPQDFQKPQVIRSVEIDLLFEILTQMAITTIPTSKGSSPIEEDLRWVYIVRGAIVEAILDVFDDDGVFCLPAMACALVSPWRLFRSGRKPVKLKCAPPSSERQHPIEAATRMFGTKLQE